MATEEYNWPIDDVRPNVPLMQSKPFEFDFPSVSGEGAAMASPSELAARAVLPENDNARRTTIILTSVVVAVALLAVGGFALLQHKDASQTAFDSCQQSITIYQSSTDRLKKTVEKAGASAAIPADALSDVGTLDTLNTAIADARKTTGLAQSCTPGASASQNRDADARITAQTRELGRKNEKVADASLAVQVSKQTKDATNARQALTDQLAQAQQLSTSANYSKIDAAARKEYSDALNQVQQLLASDQLMSVTVYQNASHNLQAGVDKVNQSALG